MDQLGEAILHLGVFGITRFMDPLVGGRARVVGLFRAIFSLEDARDLP